MMIICYTCTAGHTALLVFAHNYILLLGSGFLGCNVPTNQYIINWVEALQLIAWVQETTAVQLQCNGCACGYSKSTYWGCNGTLGTNTVCAI